MSGFSSTKLKITKTAARTQKVPVKKLDNDDVKKKACNNSGCKDVDCDGILEIIGNSKNLSAVEKKERINKLAKIISTLSKEDIKKVFKAAKLLKRYQNTISDELSSFLENE